ncbi:MAG: G/U mismatch-specific DNA glycosylase [Chloroflexi bacterium]|nr:G/U mismatch-specific DNA glycosylase [Chloroflexota bacterium]
MPYKPTPAELQAATDKFIPDVLAPNLRVVFCGINPGLYSGAVGHHFARPGNRFWPALHASGFTPRQFKPAEQFELLNLNLGLTNIAARTTAHADELSASELIAGMKNLEIKVAHYRPAVLAVLGISAYRIAWELPKAELGLQHDPWHATRVWILPNPSGLNAHYTPAKLAVQFSELREFAFQQ